VQLEHIIVLLFSFVEISKTLWQAVKEVVNVKLYPNLSVGIIIKGNYYLTLFKKNKTKYSKKR